LVARKRAGAELHMNRTEELVYQICRRSFLSLWSYANPKGKGGKELCDVLVVCDPDILIISVKEIELPKTGNPSTNLERWQRRAIDGSVNQIYGAERWLKSATEVIKSDGTRGLLLPAAETRNVYRIAVSLGGQGKAPLRLGDFGNGFVHVFDETSLEIIFQESDTITEFVSFLTAKEAFFRSGRKVLFQGGGEEDLLALYLHRGRKFPDSFDMVVIDDALWDEFQKKPEYRAKGEANRYSYYWDGIIEVLSRKEPEIGPSLTEAEIAIRVMAREDRFARRILGRSFMEFFEGRRVRSRMLVSPSGIAYVFLAVPNGTDLEFHQAELGNRCFVALGVNPNCQTVVGIGSEYFEPGKDSALFLVYLHKPEWSAEDDSHFKKMQEDLGYFVKPEMTSKHEDEYPTP
jgi:hypothetical protein